MHGSGVVGVVVSGSCGSHDHCPSLPEHSSIPEPSLTGMSDWSFVDSVSSLIDERSYNQGRSIVVVVLLVE